MILTPPANTGLPVQYVTGIDLKNFQGQLKLKNNLRFSGNVSGAGIPLASWVSLAPAGVDPIPGRDVSSTGAFSDSLGAFNLATLPGSYNVFIYPVDAAAFPPIMEYGSLKLTGDLARDYDFGDPESYPLVKGKVVDANDVGVPDIRVLAQSEDSAAPVKSSGVVTDHDGNFELLLPKIDGVYDISFGGAPPAGNGTRKSAGTIQYPSAVLSKAAEIKDGAVLYPSPDETLVLKFEQFQMFQCILSGSVKDSHGLPVAEAQVFLKAQIGGGTFQRVAKTDLLGGFAVELLAGKYVISLSPPPDSEAAFTLVDQAECEKPVQTLDFSLPDRISLTGVLTVADNSTVAGVEVRATKQVRESDAAGYSKSVFSMTDGRYKIDVDPGVYDIAFLPPESSGLARAFIGDVTISVDSTLDQTLASGGLFEGTVSDEKGRRIPDVHIEVSRIRTASDRADPIGEGSSNNEGTFSIIVP